MASDEALLAALRRLEADVSVPSRVVPRIASKFDKDSNYSEWIAWDTEHPDKLYYGNSRSSAIGNCAEGMGLVLL